MILPIPSSPIRAAFRLLAHPPKPKIRKIDENGIIFQPENSTRKYQLTPEKSVQLQFAYDTDVVICLDDCTHVDAPRSEQELSVARTIAWAKRARREYDLQVRQRKLDSANTPKIFAVIQSAVNLICAALRGRAARNWLRRVLYRRLAARFIRQAA
jgi:tRNA-guanine family transglycosylase